ncbi:hypothetical protein DRO33_05955 [Candidatus Bathyarchaeota archaeon]|nr:MAG: hypothetical protein DRO33_05955 [Candidatus Bathyarchaeota archaeon]
MSGGASNTITVHIKYGELEQTFEGPVEEVWRAINKFFSDLIPVFSLARQATVTVDLAELIEELRGLVAISNGEVVILADRRKLPDRDIIMLGLLGAYIGHKLGALPKETLTSAQLRRMLEKNAKITSTRLSELNRQVWIEKTDRGEYRVTQLGIIRFREKRLPRIAAKAGRPGP